MIRRSFRIGLLLGLAAGAAAAIAKLLDARSNPAVPTGGPAPEPWPSVAPERPTPAPPAAPAAPAPAAPAPAPAVEPEPMDEAAPAISIEVPPPLPPAPTTARKAPPKKWIEPIGDACPSSHPVKGKLSSKIFHLPGMLNYERTKPDRCYLDAGAAEADGLRAALR